MFNKLCPCSGALDSANEVHCTHRLGLCVWPDQFAIGALWWRRMKISLLWLLLSNKMNYRCWKLLKSLQGEDWGHSGTQGHSIHRFQCWLASPSPPTNLQYSNGLYARILLHQRILGAIKRKKSGSRKLALDFWTPMIVMSFMRETDNRQEPCLFVFRPSWIAWNLCKPFLIGHQMAVKRALNPAWLGGTSVDMHACSRSLLVTGNVFHNLMFIFFHFHFVIVCLPIQNSTYILQAS